MSLITTCINPCIVILITHHSNGLDELLSQNSGCEFEMYGHVSQSNENCGCCTMFLYYVRKEWTKHWWNVTTLFRMFDQDWTVWQCYNWVYAILHMRVNTMCSRYACVFTLSKVYIFRNTNLYLSQIEWLQRIDNIHNFIHILYTLKVKYIHVIRTIFSKSVAWVL